MSCRFESSILIEDKTFNGSHHHEGTPSTSTRARECTILATAVSRVKGKLKCDFSRTLRIMLMERQWLPSAAVYEPAGSVYGHFPRSVSLTGSSLFLQIPLRFKTYIHPSSHLSTVLFVVSARWVSLRPPGRISFGYDRIPQPINANTPREANRGLVICHIMSILAVHASGHQLHLPAAKWGLLEILFFYANRNSALHVDADDDGNQRRHSPMYILFIDVQQYTPP